MLLSSTDFCLLEQLLPLPPTHFRYWLPGSKLELLGAEPKQDEVVLKSTPGKSKRSVQQAYNRAKAFMKIVAQGKEQQQQQQQQQQAEPNTRSRCQPEPVPAHENGPQCVEEEVVEVKEPKVTKQCFYNDRLQGIADDSHHIPEDMNTQGHDSLSEELTQSLQTVMDDGMSYPQEGIAVSANHVCSSDNVQTMASTTDGMMHDALRHEQSLLCQEDGVNLADSFRMGRKECRDQSFIAEDTTPIGSVDAPPNVHGVA